MSCNAKHAGASSAPSRSCFATSSVSGGDAAPCRFPLRVEVPVEVKSQMKWQIEFSKLH